MAESSIVAAPAPAALPIPQYYRLKQVADRLAVSEKTVRRRLEDDPDVLIITERKRGVRKYETPLIPDTSVQRLVDSLRLRG